MTAAFDHAVKIAALAPEARMLAIHGLCERVARAEPLMWTREPPTVEGAYWYEPHSLAPYVVNVEARTFDPAIGPVLCAMGSRLVGELTGRWAGPIAAPLESSA